ncbi:PREDICTED: uncharacterized protein LOC104595481 [Nelumbo nucifera]|uniref:Uncharacterized protein LOC104595481 n=1 Tax=Nelumbo nucifera TaxID=4432 RepID=A0A1U8A0F3_NELNU|nr:PREDICTED: uncharacterized protein LOC104595481 [Nelumbo nucifera]
MDGKGNRAEAQRCLGIAEKLLTARDLIGSRRFATQAQESDPFLDGIDQILAVADVLLAAEKRINNHLDWYAILQLDGQSNDLELIKRKYRRLALLLHPDKNKSFFADKAFKLIADAWAVLSNPSKKSLYDKELNLFSIASMNELPRERQMQENQRKQREHCFHPKRQHPPEKGEHSAGRYPRSKMKQTPSPLLTTFWTACPYCYNLYEYPRVYEECSLRCQNCQRTFHAVMVLSPPPAVPGKEVYYCCWGFFPLGYSLPNVDSSKNACFPNWMPFSPMVASPTKPPEGKRNTTTSKTGLGVSDDCDSSADTDTRSKKERTFDVKEKVSPNKKSERLQKEKEKGENILFGSGRKDRQGSEDGNVTRGNQQQEVPKPPSPQKKRKKIVAKKTKKHMSKRTVSKNVETTASPETMTLDLNTEFREEVGKSTPATGVSTDTGSKDDDVGIGFFEGLDDFLGTLPIFSVVEDDKVDGTGK